MNRAHCVVLALAVVLAGCGRDPVSYEELSRSSACIYLGEHMVGSGVFVTADTVATAGHVADCFTGDMIPDVRYCRAGVWLSLTVKQIKRHKLSDLALFVLEGPGAAHARIGSSVSLSCGDALFCFGNPLGIPRIRTTGAYQGNSELSMEQRFFGPNCIRTTLRAAPGMSGSGVFNDRGQLVGILIGSVSGGDGMEVVYVTRIEPLEALRCR